MQATLVYVYSTAVSITRSLTSCFKGRNGGGRGGRNGGSRSDGGRGRRFGRFSFARDQ